MLGKRIVASLIAVGFLLPAANSGENAAPAKGDGVIMQTSAPVENWGAVADAQKITDGTITSGSTTLVSSGNANFTASDIGKAITIAGAGSASATIVTQHTSGTVAPGARVLPLLSVAAVAAGQVVSDISTSGVVPPGTLVESVSGSKVTLTDALTGAGAVDGDRIRFSSFATDLTTTISAYVNSTTVTLAAGADASVTGATVWWGTDNTAAFTAAFAHGPYVLTAMAPGCYQVSGLIYGDPAHHLVGARNYNNGNCIVGPGLPFSHKNAMAADMLIPFHNYVLQNGTANSAGKWIFDNVAFAASDPATVIACGQLWEPTGGLVWYSAFRDSRCSGYVGWHVQWWNSGEISGNVFSGTFAGMAKTMPSGLPATGVVEKMTSTGNIYIQSQTSEGYGIYEQIGGGGAYTTFVSNADAIENVYSGMRLVGSHYVFNGPHIERVANTAVGGAVTDDGSIVWNGLDNFGLTNPIVQFYEGIGADVVIGSNIYVGTGQPVIFGNHAAGPWIAGGNGSPNGAVTGAKGSLYLDSATPAVWKNCAGTTTWVNVTSGAC